MMAHYDELITKTKVVLQVGSGEPSGGLHESRVLSCYHEDIFHPFLSFSLSCLGVWLFPEAPRPWDGITCDQQQTVLTRSCVLDISSLLADMVTISRERRPQASRHGLPSRICF